jgi:hypothetical protein
MVNNIGEITIYDLTFIKDFHMAVCTEKPGICDFCDQNNSKELKVVTSSISSDNVNQQNNKSNKQNNKGNLSHQTQLNIYDNCFHLKSNKQSLKSIRTSYLNFLRSIWLDSRFLEVNEEYGEVISTVKNIHLKDITIQFGKSISECLSYQKQYIRDIPTISLSRKIKLYFKL